MPGALLESWIDHESRGLENLVLIEIGLFENYLRKTSFNMSFLRICDAVKEAAVRKLTRPAGVTCARVSRAVSGPRTSLVELRFKLPFNQVLTA